MASRKQLVVSALLATLLALGASYALGVPHTKRFDRCFPKKQWNTGTVPAQFRPCVRILNVYEDGSVELGVYDANGTERYTYGVGAQDQ